MIYCLGENERTVSFINMQENLSTIIKVPNSKMGITGLDNIANSSFLNNALQCLSHTFPLTQYFLDDLYNSDLSAKKECKIISHYL